MKIRVLPVAVWQKRREGTEIFVFLLFYDTPCKITQQLIYKTTWHTQWYPQKLKQRWVSGSQT